LTAGCSVLYACFTPNDQNIVRSAAGRAAIEGILAPVVLLPNPARIWHAESDNEITVDLALAPESPALHVMIDNDGAVQSVNLQRWGDTGEKAFGYIPFGGDILAEKRFGDFVLPARLRVGWWHGTERFSPFFEAEIISAVPNDRGRPDRPQKEDQGSWELRSRTQPAFRRDHWPRLAALMNKGGANWKPTTSQPKQARRDLENGGDH
jgi:hypothetical protein